MEHENRHESIRTKPTTSVGVIVRRLQQCGDSERDEYSGRDSKETFTTSVPSIRDVRQRGERKTSHNIPTPAEVRDNFYGSRILTDSEMKIIKLLSNGYSTKEISEAMKLSVLYVREKIKIIYDKTGLSSRLQLAVWYVVRKENI